MIDPIRSVEPRYFAIAALLCWAPIVVSFTLWPHAWWVDYVGILLHLAMFMLVAKLEAPDWAKAAGYGYVLLDVTTGVLTINDVPYSTALFIRLAGHIFCGIWMVTASLQGSWPTRVVGIITGTWLAGYTIVAAFVPITALGPASILTVIWMAMLVWNNGVGSRQSNHE